MTEHRDPRGRRHPFAAPVDASTAAGRLERAADAMRAEQLHRGPDVADEPPTGLLDLAAIRAALGDDPGGTVNPAAARWLAGDPEPAVFGEVFVDELAPAPVEHPCAVLGNAVHTSGPCGPAQHPSAPEHEPVDEVWGPNGWTTPPGPHAADVSVSDPEPVPAVVGFVAPAAPVVQAEVEARAAAEKARTVRPGPAPVFSSEQRPLDWRSRHDPRSRRYGVRARLAGSAPITDHLWPVGPVLDQGAEGACVGFGIVDAVNAMSAGGPDGGRVEALELYRRAQQLDELPGENYAGTSVLAGLAAAVEGGLLGGYLWAFGTRDIAQALLQRGPVVLGLPWPAAWFDPPADGLLTLDGAGFGELGHCLAAVGILLRGPRNLLGPYIVVQNSYGPGWGDRGLGYLHHRDLAALLHGVGEAAIPTAARPTPADSPRPEEHR